MAVGASVASANNAAATSNAYSAGMAAGSANTAAASANAYNAGVATGTANTAAAYNAGVASAPPAAMGVNYAAPPAGSIPINKNGTTYYLSGNTWFLPVYGANGVYYKVVPTP